MGNQLDGLLPFQAVVIAVNNIGLGFLVRVSEATAEGINIDHHDLDMAGLGKAAHLL